MSSQDLKYSGCLLPCDTKYFNLSFHFVIAFFWDVRDCNFYFTILKIFITCLYMAISKFNIKTMAISPYMALTYGDKYRPSVSGHLSNTPLVYAVLSKVQSGSLTENILKR